MTPHNIQENLKVHCMKCPNTITHYTVPSAVQHIQHFYISTQLLHSSILSHTIWTPYPMSHYLQYSDNQLYSRTNKFEIIIKQFLDY